MEDKQIKKVAELTSKNSFSKRVGDTPTDALQLANRRYVNLNGPTTSRPKTKIKAQQYFDTTIGRPIWFNPNSSVWTDGAGSVS